MKTISISVEYLIAVGLWHVFIALLLVPVYMPILTLLQWHGPIRSDDVIGFFVAPPVILTYLAHAFLTQRATVRTVFDHERPKQALVGALQDLRQYISLMRALWLI